MCLDRKWFMGGGGIALIILASVFYPIIDNVTIASLEKDNILKNGSALYTGLMEPSPPVKFEYYLWSIKNPEDFEAGEKPHFEQKGPYTWLETYEKQNVMQQYGAFENSSWIKFNQQTSFVWSDEFSCSDCSPDDIVVNVNIVATSIYGIVNNYVKMNDLEETIVTQLCPKDTTYCQVVAACTPQQTAQQLCNDVNIYDHINGEVNKVFIEAGVRIFDDTKTVDEIFWGFNDPVFDMLGEKLGGNTGPLEDLVWKPLSELFTDLRYGMVGLSEDGNRISVGAEMKVRNGNGNDCLDGRTTCALRSCEILSHNDKTDLSPWYGDDKLSYCNRVSGTDGMTIFPDSDSDSVIDLFVSDLCRTVWMISGGQDTYKGPDGTAPYSIPVELFYGPPEVFYSKSRPMNQCFCSPNFPEGWCTEMDGVQMVDQCNLGAPVVISGPHLASASDYFHETIDGMNPVVPDGFKEEEAEHTSYSAYELTSGAIIYNAKKIQINFMVKPDERIDVFASLTQPLVLPLFWTNETMKLDEDTAKFIYDASVKPMKIATALQYTLFSLGGLLLALTLGDLIYSLHNPAAVSAEAEKLDSTDVKKITVTEKDSEMAKMEKASENSPGIDNDAATL